MGQKRNKLKLIGFYGLVILLVGLVFSSYNWQLKKINGDQYSALAINQEASPLLMDETIAYGSKTQEVLNSHIKLSDMFIAEYKNTPSPLLGEVVPASIMAGMVKLAGGMSQGFVLADMVWPGICFLSLSYLIFLMTKKPYLSAVGSLGAMFFGHYLSAIPYLPSVLKQIVGAMKVGAYSQFLRSFHPQITMPLFILVLINLWQILKSKKANYKLVGLLAVSVGLLFYSYLFFWIFSLAFTGMFSLWSLVKKEKQKFKSLFLGGLGGFLIGLVYLINMWQFYQTELSLAFNTNFNFQAAGGLKYLLILSVMLVMSGFVKKKNLKTFWQVFYSSGIALVIIVELLNFNVDNMLGHLMLRVFYPMIIIFTWVIMIGFIKKDKKMLALLLSLGLLVYQFVVHYQYFKNNAEMFKLEPARKQVFEWLNQNTSIDSVVLTDSLVDNLYLTVMTHNNVFVPHSYLSLAPDTEVIERFLLVNKLNGNTEDRLKQQLSLTEENIQLKSKKRFNFDNCAGHYLFFRRFIEHDYYNCSVSEEMLEGMVSEYRQMEPDLDLYKEKYQMDYWLTKKDFDQGELLWENQVYKIYGL